MKSLIFIASYCTGAIAQLYIDSWLIDPDIFLQARHLDRRFEPFNKHQLLQKRSGGVKQQQGGQSSSQQTNQGKDQRRGRKKGGQKGRQGAQQKDQQKNQQAGSHPQQDPNATAEITVRGPGQAQKVEGTTEFSTQNIPPGQIVRKQASHPFSAHAKGRSTANPTAVTAFEPPANRPVHGKAVGAAARTQVLVPPQGRGHFRAETPEERESVDLQGGEYKEIGAGGHGPGTVKVEANVSDGGAVSVTSISAPTAGMQKTQN